MDIVVANYATDNIALIFGYGNGSLAKSVTYCTGMLSTPCMVTTDDFNDDYLLDIAVANFGTNNVGIFLGIGDGSFSSQTMVSTGSSRPLGIFVDDLNNDRAHDFVTANYGTHSLSIFHGDGNGRFSSPMTYFMGYDSVPIAISAGDLNSDGQMDLAVANYGTNNVGILLGNGSKIFANIMIFSTGSASHPHSIAISDFNRDNLSDIVVANYGTNSIGILFGIGNGLFTYPMMYSLDHSSPHAIAVEDLNKNNRTDLIVTNQGKYDIADFLGQTNGIFANPIMYSTGSLSTTSLVITDFNNDNEQVTLVQADSHCPRVNS